MVCRKKYIIEIEYEVDFSEVQLGTNEPALRQLEEVKQLLLGAPSDCVAGSYRGLVHVKRKKVKIK